MQSFVIDLLVLLVLGFFTWNGFRNGFFLTASSILIFFAALIIGTTVANANAEKASVAFDSILDWVAESATEEAMNKLGATTSGMSEQQMVEVVKSALESLGIHGSASDYLALQVKNIMLTEAPSTLYETISRYFVRSLAWIALFFGGYIISSLVLSLVVNFISTVFKFPVIKQLDLFGGLALGFLQGLFIMFLIGFALRYVGILIPQELLGKTTVLRFFIDANPFGSIIKL